MNDSDKLHRFIFDNCDTRGEIISLADSYRTALATTDYPMTIQRLLGEFQAAVGLLSATLKFDGIITLQARGDGPISLIMADCTRQHNLRAVAEFDRSAQLDEQLPLNELIGHGQLTITIDPSGGKRHQGIVPLEQGSLAHCLEDYFKQSEQLPTRIWLSADGNCAAGLFLQALPQQKILDPEQNAAQWQHLVQLANTIKPEEQLQLNHSEQLHRLFHQEPLRLFDPVDLQFSCSCSEQRTANMLKTLDRSEINNILKENGEVEITCHFCNQQYRFSSADIDTIFGAETPTIH